MRAVLIWIIVVVVSVTYVLLILAEMVYQTVTTGSKCVLRVAFISVDDAHTLTLGGFPDR